MQNSNSSKYNLLLLPIIVIATMSIIVGISTWQERKALDATNTDTGTSPKSSFATETADGKQAVSIIAKAGYFPKEVTAKAETETLLTVSTKNTYDCSLALVIPKLNFSKNLKPVDSVQISIPPQTIGSEINGTCSMGMYHFKIKFV